jgi:predicted DNA-binding protein with PD1-like motif
VKSKSIKEGPDRVFVLILDQGEDAFKAIADFANRERIDGASVTAIGAFSEAKVGWFDLAAKKYKPIAVKEQCEVLSLMGDIAQGDDGKRAFTCTRCSAYRTARFEADTYYLDQFSRRWR